MLSIKYEKGKKCEITSSQTQCPSTSISRHPLHRQEKKRSSATTFKLARTKKRSQAPRRRKKIALAPLYSSREKVGGIYYDIIYSSAARLHPRCGVIICFACIAEHPEMALEDRELYPGDYLMEVACVCLSGEICRLDLLLDKRMGQRVIDCYPLGRIQHEGALE